MSSRNLAAYRHIIKAAAHEDSFNIKRLVAALVLSSLRIILIAAIYHVAYLSHAQESFPYANAMWSIAIYFAFNVGLGVRDIFKLIDNEVRTGAIEVELIRPLDWRLVKVCQLIGKNSLEFLLLLIVLPVVLLVVAGKPETSHLTLPVVVIFMFLTFLATITATAIYVMVGLSAFWLNESFSVYRIVDKSIMVFGGAFVPIALLPESVQTFVRYSPLGVYAAPTQLFNPSIIPVLIPTLVSAMVWSVALLWLCQIVWRKAERRIEVNGG